MYKKDLKEMEEADCLFNIDDPEIIYSSVLDTKLVNHHQDINEICLLWITQAYDPEEWVK